MRSLIIVPLVVVALAVGIPYLVVGTSLGVGGKIGAISVRDLSQDGAVWTDGSGTVCNCTGLNGTYCATKNCSTYVYCMSGRAIYQSCYDDRNFDTVTNTCMLNVTCGGRVTNPPPTPTTTTPIPAPPTPNFVCPRDGQFADQCSDGRHYFVCSYGTATRMNCSANTVYSPWTWNCVNPEDADKSYLQCTV